MSSVWRNNIMIVVLYIIPRILFPEPIMCLVSRTKDLVFESIKIYILLFFSILWLLVVQYWKQIRCTPTGKKQSTQNSLLAWNGCRISCHHIINNFRNFAITLNRCTLADFLMFPIWTPRNKRDTFSTTIADSWMAVIVKREEGQYGQWLMSLLLIHTGRRHSPPSAAPPHMQHGRTEDLGRKSRQFKTLNYVLYNVLYLAYIIPLVIIFHTIDSQ